MKNQSTIAVVDDHALLRKAVNYRLTGMGYKVVMEAENIIGGRQPGRLLPRLPVRTRHQFG